MTRPLDYAGKCVVVTGCASGMGRATAGLLLALGAQVHGLDYREADLALASFRRVDLRDPVSIERAADAAPSQIDALFNCAGLGPTFSPLDIMKVNFIGTRYLSEILLTRMREGGAIGSIASTAAMGWTRRVPVLKQLIAIEGYADAVRWSEANAEVLADGYTLSKEAVVVWTMLRSQDLITRGIRINCILPGLTQTPMLTDQIAVKTSAEVLDAVIQPSGRPARPEEQAFFLAVINSDSASYLNGAAINVDGGRLARLAMGLGSAPMAAPTGATS
jgi:NAD(P)-dependent dehydrogenase (short-subunit alcohol dehydrogenase family)